METRIQNHLGCISFLLKEYRAASDHYTEALAIATDCHGPMMVILNCIALAEMRLEETRRSCQLAFEDTAQMRGSVYQAVGP